MSLSDILSCEEDELLELITLEEPYSKGNWFMAKRIGSIELSMFGEISGIDNYESLSNQFQLVGEPLPEGPWPVRIPDSLIQGIASLTEIEIVCKLWSEIDEFDNSVSSSNLEDYLKRLNTFIQKNKTPFFLINAL